MDLSIEEWALKFFEPLPGGIWRDRETGEIIVPKKGKNNKESDKTEDDKILNDKKLIPPNGN